MFLLLLCFGDAFFTWLGVSGGMIEEANPLMDRLLGTSVPAFFFVKLSLPAVLIALSGRLDGSALFRISLGAALAVYVSVFLLHAAWIAMM
ncbi:hypothetical protein ABID49_001894 [Bhargavaea ullalensis]|uniref:DUF5658 domain-containing protein n=1 Tax=Bhargavaea ullalensis TaxID=1265685 RepID=A0ABV2GCQ9_9BACL